MYKHTWVVYQNYVKAGDKLLSRILMKCNENSNELVVDYINNNTLDNKKCNLRLITQSQNTLNQLSKDTLSKYIGVSFDKNNKKWIAQIVVNDEIKYLGVFDREQDTALARDYSTKKIL